MAVINAFEFANFLCEGYDVDNRRVADEWNPLYRAVIFRLCGQSSAIQIDNGEGKSSLTEVCLYLLSRHSELKKRISSKFAPSDCGWTHVRIEFVIKDEDIRQPSLITANTAEFPGTTYVVGLCGNRDDQDWNFYLYQGTLDDTTTHIKTEKGLKLVDNESFRKSVATLHGAKWNKWTRVRDWLDEIKEFTSIEVVKQNVEFQLKGAGDASAMLHNIKPQGNEDYDAAFFQQLIAPELVSNAMEFAARLEGRDSDKEERNLEDTLLRSLQSASNATIAISGQEEKLQQAQIALDKFKPVLDKAHEIIGASHRYDELLTEVAQSASLIYELAEKNPFPGIPRNPERRNYDKRIMSIFSYMVIDRKGGVLILDEGLNMLTGVEANKINEKAQDLGLQLFILDSQPFDFKGDLVNYRSGNKSGGYSRKGYPLYSAIHLILKLVNHNAFNVDTDLTDVLKQVFEIAINELDTNIYRRETYQSVKMLELETINEKHQSSVKRDAEKEIEDLQASVREVGENQIAFETFKTQAENFPHNLREMPLEAESWLNNEYRSIRDQKSEHDIKIGNNEIPYKNWEMLTETYGLMPLSDIRDQLNIQKRESESNTCNAKTVLEKTQSRIKEDITPKLRTAKESFEHAQKTLKQLEELQPQVEVFGQIFGDIDPELLNPLQEKNTIIKSKGELDHEIQSLHNQLDRFKHLSSNVDLFQNIFGGVDPHSLNPFSDLQSLQKQIRNEQEIIKQHLPLVAALKDFTEKYPEVSPDAWLETIEKERIVLQSDQKDNDNNINEHNQELADLYKHSVADSRIYSEALQKLDKASIPFKRLHYFIKQRATDSNREAQLLTLFASALSAPVFESIEAVDSATRLLEEHRLTIPVFLAKPLTEFIKEGVIDVNDCLAHTFLAGRRTRKVEILLNPDLIKEERKKIEEKITLFQERNLCIKTRLTEIQFNGYIVKLALDAKKALSTDSEQCLSRAQKNLVKLQPQIPDFEKKASPGAIDSISGMKDFLALGGEQKLREIENDALPVATEQMTALLSQIAEMEPKTTTEALAALNSATIYKRAGGKAEFQRSKENATITNIQFEDLTKQLSDAVSKEQKALLALEGAHADLLRLMNTYSADMLKLDDAITFETNGSLLFMRKSTEISQSLEGQLEKLQQFLKTDFKRAQKFKDWSSKEQKDFAQLIAAAKAKKGKADVAAEAAKKKIKELSEQITSFKEYSNTLHDLAVTIRRQYSKIFILSDDILGRIKSGNMMNKGALFTEVQEARVALMREPNPTPEFLELLNNINQQIGEIHLDANGIRHCEKERDNAQSDFISRRNDFCAKARNGEIKGLHTLEIEHIEKAMTLEELKAVEGLENKIKQRIEGDLIELTGAREAMQTAKEASIDNMVKFSLLADLNLKTMNEVMEKTPKARFIIETQVASEERIRQVVEWLIGQIEDRERAQHQRMQGVNLNTDIASKNRDYGVMIRDTLYQHLFIDPHVYFTHAGIWEGKKSPIINDKLSMGQKTALHIMWMIKQAEYSLARAVRDYGTRKERKAAAQKAQRILFFDGLFSNLSNENIIDDAFEGLKYVGDNFQLIGLLHHPRYVNNPEIFKTHLVGQRFKRIGEKRSRGFVAVEPWQEGGNMAIFSSYYKKKPENGEAHAETQ